MACLQSNLNKTGLGEEVVTFGVAIFASSYSCGTTANDIVPQVILSRCRCRPTRVIPRYFTFGCSGGIVGSCCDFGCQIPGKHSARRGTTPWHG